MYSRSGAKSVFLILSHDKFKNTLLAPLRYAHYNRVSKGRGFFASFELNSTFFRKSGPIFVDKAPCQFTKCIYSIKLINFGDKMLLKSI